MPIVEMTSIKCPPGRRFDRLLADQSLATGRYGIAHILSIAIYRSKISMTGNRIGRSEFI
ncbi:hypothetical protein KL86APRO_11536 [uncultured Alphaproteobacteria bacterium]|uniref:Uncharacterized protein n=1 Tax=uncultured Alphaproteobacteria bacterium TaxID=91750 RepID=A0A212JRM7_9PROT|nr:hypothetical protein KL86APRO_11536 [uncultured Alphaproteobacteria bacterium]